MTTEINYSLYSWYLMKSLGKLFLIPHQWKTQLSRIKFNLELLRVAATPRYTPIDIDFFGCKLKLVDSASFLWTYDEIFGMEIYKFSSANSNPVIIDCGANIGLSILYFKNLFPNSRILAFEPDVNVFNVLEQNIKKFKLSGVELLSKAVWNCETVLEFTSEGADAGRLSQQNESQINKYQVSTVRLRDYLQQPVDLLKIDIEGAETEVIEDCYEQLVNVNKIFVEYHSFVDKPQSLNVLINVLSQAGFRLYIHTVSKSKKPLEFVNVYNGMDMQLNIFGWREHS
jgi:FkbM family methyltransferase